MKNYPDISKEDLSAATGGKLPEKKSDLLRLLYPSDLSINNMFTLFEEDYPEYMHDYTLTCIAGGMAEAMYGPVREYLKQECRKRLEPDMVKVLDRFEEYLKDRKGFSDK